MKNVKGIRNFYNIKKLYLVLGLFLVLLLGVGYAVLNTTLSINGVADISKNTWNVHFENVVVKDGNVVATNPATISDKGTEVSFTVSLSKPGDSYIFEVDMVNNGTIDALIDEVVKTELTAEQEKYLTFLVTYADGLEIKQKDYLKAGEQKTILVSIQYKFDITNNDLVSIDESLTLTMSINYIQDDGTGAKSLYSVIKKQSILDNVSSDYVSSSSGISFALNSSDTNGKGVYTISSTSSYEYPIHYYRGAITNNNVIFADFCWKIVRTTDSGGIKIIYNGKPDTDGSCTSTGNDTHIEFSSFNSNSSSPTNVGYMSSTAYTYSSKYMNISGFSENTQTFKSGMKDTNYIYSDSVTYDESTGKYTLVNGENRVWSSTYTSGGNQYKYTCFSETETSCEIVNYIVHSYFNSATYYITLTGGEIADTTENKEIVYGNDVIYDELSGMYTLQTTTKSKVKDWSTDFETIVGSKGFRYTCFSESDTCSEVNFIHYHDNSIHVGAYGTSYYIKLTDGKKIENVYSEISIDDNDARNQTDSTIKTVIDTWYEKIL